MLRNILVLPYGSSHLSQHCMQCSGAETSGANEFYSCAMVLVKRLAAHSPSLTICTAHRCSRVCKQGSSLGVIRSLLGGDTITGAITIRLQLLDLRVLGGREKGGSGLGLGLWG